MQDRKTEIYEQLKRRKLTRGIYMHVEARPEKMFEHFNQNILKIF
jgi:hypothetical protein